MRRALWLGVALAAACLPAAGSAKNPGGPFYLVPSVTKECLNVKNCVGAPGPWVSVPARGEATYLLACPSRRAFVVGGTDARASSPAIRVWFEGKLGGPLGAQPNSVKGRAALLFHAVANDGKQGSFQPILGCVSLVDKNKRSTVSVKKLPGTNPGAPLDLRTEQIGLRLASPRTVITTTIRCPKSETLVGSWSAVAAATANPPNLMYAKAVTIRTSTAGNRVRAVIRKSRAFGPLAPLSWAQIGAKCEP